MACTITIGPVHIDQVTMLGATAPWLQWHVGPITTVKESSMPLEVTMSTEQRTRLSITPMTPAGQPAQIDGEALWEVTTGTCTLTPIDATSVYVRGAGAGDSLVTVSADADMDNGIVTIMDTATIHVTLPMAANMGLQADPPELIPT